MKRFALIGHPVAGSMSPVVFTAAYSGKYPYDLIDAPFEDAWAKFLSSYHGINVTAPYKQDAYAAVDTLSEEARISGAVNLVVKGEDGLLHGYNADIDGVIGAIREVGTPVHNAVVIGAGGAARAAVVAAWKLGCQSITILNRTLEKAEAMVSSMAPQISAASAASASGAPVSDAPASGASVSGLGSGSLAPGSLASGSCAPDSSSGFLASGSCAPGSSSGFLASAPDSGAPGLGSTVAPSCRALPLSELPTLRPDLVVYTVPGAAGIVPGMSEDFLKNAILLEAEYKRPILTDLPCKRYVSGKRWLLHQALAGYSLFTGETPDLPSMESAL